MYYFSCCNCLEELVNLESGTFQTGNTIPIGDLACKCCTFHYMVNVLFCSALNEKRSISIFQYVSLLVRSPWDIQIVC